MTVPTTARACDVFLARTDPDHRASTAEWCAAYHAYKLVELRHCREGIYINTLKIRKLALSLVERGRAAYADEVSESDNKLAEMRAEYEMHRAHSAVALDRLFGNHQRAEFAVLALRYRTDYWPTTLEVFEFMGEVFGLDDDAISDALTEVINEPSQCVAGVFLTDGGWLAERMGFPLPEGADPQEWRLYVSAECQLGHRLHEVFDAWTFEPLPGEEDA